MQIGNYLRAAIFNSSAAMHKLALAKPKERTLATAIISAKNESAHCKLERVLKRGVESRDLSVKQWERLDTQIAKLDNQIAKYESCLSSIRFVGQLPHLYDKLKAYRPEIPRPVVIAYKNETLV